MNSVTDPVVKHRHFDEHYKEAEDLRERLQFYLSEWDGLGITHTKEDAKTLEEAKFILERATDELRKKAEVNFKKFKKIVI